MNELIQGTPEWLELRRTHIGASDAPIIMRVSPWTTPRQLFERKLCIVPEQKTNAAMLRGQESEPYNRKAFEDWIGAEFKPCVLFDKEYPWMMASMDGVSSDGRAVEIKLANKADHARVKSGKVPKKYFPQLQHQMRVGGLDDIFYWSCLAVDFDNNLFDYAVVSCGRDQNYINELVKEENKFYECLITYNYPEGG